MNNLDYTFNEIDNLLEHHECVIPLKVAILTESTYLQDMQTALTNEVPSRLIKRLESFLLDNDLDKIFANHNYLVDQYSKNNEYDLASTLKSLNGRTQCLSMGERLLQSLFDVNISDFDNSFNTILNVNNHISKLCDQLDNINMYLNGNATDSNNTIFLEQIKLGLIAIKQGVTWITGKFIPMLIRELKEIQHQFIDNNIQSPNIRLLDQLERLVNVTITLINKVAIRSPFFRVIEGSKNSSSMVKVMSDRGLGNSKMYSDQKF
jgi:hypothetical protein